VSKSTNANNISNEIPDEVFKLQLIFAMNADPGESWKVKTKEFMNGLIDRRVSG
jgi:hypothetical protein